MSFSYPRLPMKLGASLALALALVLAPAIAHADELRECAAAYEQTQRLQQKNELMSALESAERCAKPACPSLLSTECTKWERDIKAKLAALVIHVRGADGCPLPQATVRVDAPTRKGEGTLLVEPGQHTLTVTDPDTHQEKTESINFGMGERRDIDIELGNPGAACVPAPESKSPFAKLAKAPTISLVSGGAGAGFLVLGVTLGVIGAVKRGDLDSCKPNCTEKQLDGVQPFFTAGDIFGVIGLIGLAAGAITYFVLQPPAASNKTGLYVAPSGGGVRF